MALKAATKHRLLAFRDGLLLISFSGKGSSLSSKGILSWMATCFLCNELADALDELAVALMSIRAKEAPIGE